MAKRKREQQPEQPEKPEEEPETLEEEVLEKDLEDNEKQILKEEEEKAR